uniref:Mitochondrial import inner membrane translocase subunit n=1 Tax=Chenopodium quinoa TaxID=63459 RepID=A0A803KRR0_CHEQI
MANNNLPPQLAKEQVMFMAEKEMEYRVELFNKLSMFVHIRCHSFVHCCQGLREPSRWSFMFCGFRLTQTCFRKCTDKSYKESELNMAENSCIDRCVSKYWQGDWDARMV